MKLWGYNEGTINGLAGDDMGALEDYKNSVMKDYDGQPGWQPEYEREAPLEAPMFSPDDLIGSGLGKLLMSALAPLGLMALKGGAKAGTNATMRGQAGAVGGKGLNEFEQRMLEAQKNAALPVEKGGLGLPPDNTPLERAKAMGYDTEVYHYSRHKPIGVHQEALSEFTPMTSGKGAYFFDGLGTHVGSAKAAEDRFNKYWAGANGELVSGYTMPLLMKSEKQLLSPKGVPYSEGALNTYLKNTLERAGFDLKNRPRDAQIAARNSIGAKYNTVPYVNKIEDKGSVSYVVPDGANLRSRNAAFDPKKRDSKDLMAFLDELSNGDVA